ncbi:MAG: hypothetical protein ACYDDF_13540 [Thermoplasmatota archaeon]
MGGAIAGASGNLLPLGLCVMGLLGGLSFGWFWRATPSRTGLAGAVGFAIGLVLPLQIMGDPHLTSSWPKLVTDHVLVPVGILCGALTGALLAIAWGRRSAIATLAIGGAVGFGIAFLIPRPMADANADSVGFAVSQLLFLASVGVLGGLAIGWAASRARGPVAEGSVGVSPGTSPATQPESLESAAPEANLHPEDASSAP